MSHAPRPEPPVAPEPPDEEAPRIPSTPSGASGPPGSPVVGVERRRKVMGWRSRDILRATLLVCGVYIALRLLWLANHLVFAVFLGVLFGLALARGVDVLERVRVPRGVGAAAIALAFLGLLFGTGALIAPTVTEQARELRNRLPDAISKVEQWLEERQQGLAGVFGGAADSSAASRTEPARPAAAPAAGGRDAERAAAPADTGENAPAPSIGSRVGESLGGISSFVFPVLQSTVSVFGGIILVFFIAIYIGIAPGTYHNGLVRLFPKKDRDKAGEVLSITATVLRRWLVTQLIAMAVIGVVTTVALTLLDVRAAFALGVIAGLLEFVPTIGPLLSALPAIAMGLLDSPEKAIAVAVLYAGIQFAENHLLIPLLMKEGLDLPPALTIVAQALMALVFGFLGLLVAVPLVAAALVPIKLLYVRGILGDEDIDVLGDGEDDD